MGKNKKKKKSPQDGQKTREDATQQPPKVRNNESSKSAPKKKNRDPNPLLTAQHKFLKSLSPQSRNHFFSSKHVTPEKRAEIWEDQADLGETLVNSYAWATPDPRLLKVFQHFGPIVEVGCGANAYWSKWMNGEGGVDVVAFDMSLDAGGKIGSGSRKKSSNKKAKQNKVNNNDDGSAKTGGLVIRLGNPETLAKDEEIRDSDRALFLCYPDEEEYQRPEGNDGDDDEEDVVPPMSMGAACLEHFTGNTVIHVGELFGDTLSLEQAPFGRSSSNEFQQRLAGEYHCILKMRLTNNWLHVKDTLSVWKRSETCCMAFQNDDDSEGDEEEDEVYYKYIPPRDVLPVDLAAPCVAHLLGRSDVVTRKRDIDEEESYSLFPDTGKGGIDDKRGKSSDGGKKKRKKDSDILPIAGNAW
mmetsp:Transcript_10706/g.19229  ORF Transcript_10706/g.19229 Transcript_10706/m.19229 type:complete len:413 (-) Transcript_10706:1254-2492(-)|eukprot:CAMPEP_0201649910 /NCGR_PEP_ID=MMETSP0493-20130528/40226_1 /ASSEMBLY_ACC=CAM_ASM_000838 /TAXON_ID=420259 /ORGANISM="Thalassiosira gravida, Strain GMp14c1" /LENGTH=412 /DNA_ID=CAMNT_0048125869 /DNA_START=53 /DNA_END=1294 /DNA_ORIENTATION=-